MASENPYCRCKHRRSQHYNGEICVVVFPGIFRGFGMVCSCSSFWPKGKRHVYGYDYALVDAYEPESLDAPIHFQDQEYTLADTLVATHGDPTAFLQDSNEDLNAFLRKQAFIELYRRYYARCMKRYEALVRSRATLANSYNRTIELARAKREEQLVHTEFMIFDLWMYGHKTQTIVDIMNSLKLDKKITTAGATKSIKKVREWAEKEYDVRLPKLSNERGVTASTIQERNAKIIEIVLKSGLSCVAVAKQFGLSQASVNNIVNNYKWAQARKEQEKEFLRNAREVRREELEAKKKALNEANMQASSSG